MSTLAGGPGGRTGWLLLSRNKDAALRYSLTQRRSITPPDWKKKDGRPYAGQDLLCRAAVRPGQHARRRRGPGCRWCQLVPSRSGRDLQCAVVVRQIIHARTAARWCAPRTEICQAGWRMVVGMRRGSFSVPADHVVELREMNEWLMDSSSLPRGRDQRRQRAHRCRTA